MGFLFLNMTRIEVEKIEKPYKTMAISPARDKRLSYKARGILYYLLTKPDKWQCQVYDLACQSEKDGLKAVKSALKELVQFGYAELLTSVDPKTKKFTGKFYKVRDYSKKPAKS